MLLKVLEQDRLRQGRTFGVCWVIMGMLIDEDEVLGVSDSDEEDILVGGRGLIWFSIFWSTSGGFLELI